MMNVTAWSGADAVAGAELECADAVVAYGRGETLAAIRARLAPEARFIPFGHRTSVGYVARETLADAATADACARGIATDALLYDGDGCLSLHAVFVERGAAVDPRAFASRCADAFELAAVEFPAGDGDLDPEATAYARDARFRASQGSGIVFGGMPATRHFIVLDPPADLAPPLARRTIALYSVDEPDDALAFVRRHALPLEAVGVCGATRPDVEAFAVASGAARIARLGTLQRPPLGGEHGGAGRILPFVRPIYR
jgi:hypothetical protein